MPPANSRASSTRRHGLPELTIHPGRIVRALFLVTAVVIVIDGVVGDRGLLAMRRARAEQRALAAAIARQRAENARLREEARRLREDPAAIEELARGELGLIRPGEKLFILRDSTRNDELVPPRAP